MQEVITDAAAAGVPLHIFHINSAATTKTAQALRIFDGVRARGLDVTTEAYPYTASMTEIASAAYSGWEFDGITDLELVFRVGCRADANPEYAAYTAHGSLDSQ
jgi:hypothetical protein